MRGRTRGFTDDLSAFIPKGLRDVEAWIQAVIDIARVPKKSKPRRTVQQQLFDVVTVREGEGRDIDPALVELRDGRLPRVQWADAGLAMLAAELVACVDDLEVIAR